MNPVLREIEDRLQILYLAGHVTGHGAGTTDHSPDCAGCAETRVLADRYDAFWNKFDADRLAASRPAGKAW